MKNENYKLTLHRKVQLSNIYFNMYSVILMDSPNEQPLIGFLSNWPKVMQEN